METGTLAIIIKGDLVLLGEKKRGEIGRGTLNAPGGKREAGESAVECVTRETFEETGIVLIPELLHEVAKIVFFAGGIADFEVAVFRTEHYDGNPRETSEMIPGWYPIDRLPFERMLESDLGWFERVAKGGRFYARVYYKERAKGFERTEFFPYRSHEE